MATQSEERDGDDALDHELLPIVLALRELMKTRGSLETVTPEQMRVRASALFAKWNEDPEHVASVTDFSAGGVPVRLYDPVPESETGLLVYAHGGGWVIGDLDFEDAALRRLSSRSGVKILSVDYRLAPEHSYPAPIEDLQTVVSFVANCGLEASIDFRRIGLGGASAGANLALGTALKLRDLRQQAAAFLLLMYGPYSGGAETASYRLFADGRFGLSRAAMDWFWETYLGRDRDQAEAYAVPLNDDLSGLSSVFLNYAELDVLRDDSVRLADRLAASGVSVEARGYEGAIHGFTQYTKSCALARRAIDEAADALAAALG